MGPVTPFIPAILSAVSTVASFIGSKKEGDTGEANARLREQETAVASGRLEDQQRLNVSSAKARAAASGVKPGVGSQALFISTLKQKQDQELADLKAAGASRADIERRTADAASAGGFGSAFAGFAGAFGKLPKGTFGSSPSSGMGVGSEGV